MVKADQLSIAIDDGNNVWISLPDVNPITDPFGFVIGTGTTRDEALADAVAALEDVLERLQGPPDALCRE